ncbi:MAG: ABC transporter ATP-binding protein [Alphaproteobacteria bacterium]
MTAPVLETRSLSVAYGPIRALSGVSIRIGEGETVAVVGANGAGKTTLMKALSGLLPAQSGEIAFQGRSIKGRGPHDLARAGMLHVPEGRGTLGTLTVEENLRIAYDVRPARLGYDEATAAVFARFPRLADRRRQRASSMSGGEQQMLALARAIVNPPAMLLVDEPSLGLSPLMVKEAFNVLHEFRDRGTTMLVVEQNVRSALRLADRGYVLRQGEVIASGPAAELLADDQLLNRYLGTRTKEGA